MPIVRDYKKIKSYQVADSFAVAVYKLTREFPREELYGVTSQLRRAAVSVATNIVEGANRQHKKDYLQFLYIAKGSMAEAQYLLHLAYRLGFVKEDLFKQAESLRDEASRTLFGLIRVVEGEV